jgi:preprotein translocase subunit SecG
VLLVLFVVNAILLILLVLVQNEEGDSLGGIFAGGSSSAFGSRSGNVLTRTTSVLGALFLIISLSLALVNRTPGGSGVEAAGRELSTEEAGPNWIDEELNPSLEPLPEDGFLPEDILLEDILPEDILQDYSILPDDEILETGAVE